MRIFLSILGMIGSFLLIYYRERVGDSIGDSDWAERVGGIYNVIVIIGIILFFWSIAELTHTTDFLFGLLRYLIPGMQPTGQI